MKKLIINIILPFPVTRPVGGAKIMYEYANRLSQNGHSVTIFHSIKRPFKNSKTPLFFKQLIYALRGAKRPKWFPLRKEIKSVIVPSITDTYIPDADIVIGTWWQMTYAISDLNVSKGKKFNLIQDYEVWTGQAERVHDSYKLPVNNLVIARYLQDLVAEKSGIVPALIPNAIDEAKFNKTTEQVDRNPFSVIMLYSEEPRKGTKFGLDALKLVKQKVPKLSVVLFGVYPQPADLPEWITYYQKPDNLRKLYNDAAVFFSPSLGEGWALPPAEAMACGCAVICTAIGGHQDYAFDNETALLVQPENIEDMSQKIVHLFSDSRQRYLLAENGETLISTKFSWANSIEKIEAAFYKAL